MRGDGGGGGRDARDSDVKLTSMGTPWKGKCRKCGLYGHWVKECKKPVKEEGIEAAHHVNADTEQPALMVVHVCNVVQTMNSTAHGVFLNQECVFSSKYEEGVWVLDTGATNHMTGCWASLATLDEMVGGTVRFVDGSTVEIYGIGAVTIADRNQNHWVLTAVYYIPSLKCNIVSLGQL